MNLNHIKYTSLASVLAVVLSACSSLPALDEVVEDNSQKYRKAEVMPPLDIPPDLSSARINDDFVGNQTSETYSEYDETAANPLAAKYNIAPENKPVLTGEGDQRRLIVPGDRDVTWTRLLSFWEEVGLTIRRKDQRIGLMDTGPDADDYAYRARMERGNKADSAEIYISAVAFDANPQKNEAMIRQLAEYLGNIYQDLKQQEQAAAIEQQQQQTARYSEPEVIAINAVLMDEAGDHYALLVEQDFSDTWLSVGTVLDNKDFSVEDRERSRGVYFVRYIDPFNEAKPDGKGMLSSLAFWQSDEEQAPEEFYYIKLIAEAQETKIIILDVDQVRTSSETARRILGLLQEQLVK